MNSKPPSVFISYSWDDEDHKLWVKQLADKLLSDGIDVSVDQYDLSLGDRLPQYMEQSITNSDYVLIICTPQYKLKADKRTGGVGYEGHVITGELFSKGNERKFIPIIRNGNFKTAIPSFLSGKLGIDLTENDFNGTNYRDLLTTIYGVRKKPPIGNTPSNLLHNKFESRKDLENEPIQILGIIADEVTVPKMDGTRGSALYKIPFRLSKAPSNLWRKIFVDTWNDPPRFTTMHRPGIASTYGDKIILDGTTIEEVKKYHRDTLVLCVTTANEKEARFIKDELIRKAQEEQRISNHYANVKSVADEIKF